MAEKKRMSKAIVLLAVAILVIAVSGLFSACMSSCRLSRIERKVESLENVQMDILLYLQKQKAK